MSTRKILNGKGKFALVTGAAGGIGQPLTRRLLDAGFHVLMLDINADGLDAARQKLGGATTGIVCDLTDSASVAAAAATVQAMTRRVDVIVNNAGLIKPGPFLSLQEQDIDLQVQINLLGPLRVLHHFLPAVPAGGSVVNIVSMAGILPLADSTVYTAGKFGLRGFSSSLSLEVRSRGIRVSSIFPSGVDTPMLRMEAQSGGSPLNFVSDPLSAEQVADLAIRAVREGRLEYYLPYGDGVLSRIFGCIPWILPRLLPIFLKKGIVGHKRYLAKIGAAPSDGGTKASQ
ncbi:SDR family NAD(P)-dependent oxidoreductase [Rhizobium sp. AG855]|uniref:SDR family NAD(P)-dependent oxidoreductase n=1 Tax=Rhizobium sp. AG855 TaxID=2183898 RepID=UPI000E7470F1|nr:SDR family NAD(P)-dependent oxidoreductase [Rhizobium sp. AG855]RKE77430.1 short-subunit dehydrogenase [Rhizobium sp. AG855]